MPLFHCGSGSSIYNGTAVALRQCCLTLGSKRQRQRKCRDIHTHTYTHNTTEADNGARFSRETGNFKGGWMFNWINKRKNCDDGPLKKRGGWLLFCFSAIFGEIFVGLWEGIRCYCSCSLVFDNVAACCNLWYFAETHTLQFASKTGIKCSRLTWMSLISFLFNIHIAYSMYGT